MFARLCEAREVLGKLPATREHAKGPAAPTVTQPGPAMPRNASGGADCQSTEALSKTNKSARESDLHPLLLKGISAGDLAAVLDEDPLPTDQMKLKELLGHLRHLIPQLRGNGVGSLERLRQDVAASQELLHEQKGRLDVMESELPVRWSPPEQLWTELMGSPPPAGASVHELRAAAEAALRGKQEEAVRHVDDHRLKMRAMQQRIEDLNQDAALKEAEARALEAENALLADELQEQERREAEAEADRRRAALAESRLADVRAAEDRRRASAFAARRGTVQIQREWRKRQARNFQRLLVVLRIQFRMRRWLRRRHVAAVKIQGRWRNWRGAGKAAGDAIKSVGRSVGKALGHAASKGRSMLGIHQPSGTKPHVAKSRSSDDGNGHDCSSSKVQTVVMSIIVTVTAAVLPDMKLMRFICCITKFAAHSVQQASGGEVARQHAKCMSQ